MFRIFSIVFILSGHTLLAQNGHDLIFPDSAGWSVRSEGEIITFRIKAIPQEGIQSISITGLETFGMQVDSTGNFTWTPAYNLVDRIEQTRDFALPVIGLWKDGTRIRKMITFTIRHVNRPPVIEELPVFYVKQATRNSYQVPAEYVTDPDGDPIVFKPVSSSLPEGATMTSQGLITWTPSRKQFTTLKGNPLTIEFIVQDQPSKAETRGKLRIAQTQLDLPPEILIVPGDSAFTIKEDATISLKLYVSDPNGDDDVLSVGFIPSDQRISQNALKENTQLQYEFIWTPGYDFVDDAQKSLKTDLVFFCVDKEGNRTQRKATVVVIDTENLLLKDGLQYQKYRNSLLNAMELINLLDENQKKLNVDYKKAKKGKKKRSMVNASLGAVTGFSPVMFEPEQAKVVSAVGGTTVLTMNTLEVTEVIGKSKDDIMDKIKINVDIRNRAQSAGDEFARKYAQKSARRTIEFERDIDKLRTILNDQRIVLLELDAFKKKQPEYTNKDLKKTFADFSEEN
ncbi:MAG: Ig-like domain-containing protein [Flammeovirgaceae bacterium]|nr:MAG: Ig-like domain-containing protein [Flammeovirgaceae bacterium]